MQRDDQLELDLSREPARPPAEIISLLPFIVARDRRKRPMRSVEPSRTLAFFVEARGDDHAPAREA